MDPHCPHAAQPSANAPAAPVQLSTNKENVSAKQRSTTQQQWRVQALNAGDAAAAPRAALRPPLGPRDAAADDAFPPRRRSVDARGLDAAVFAFDDDASGEPSNGAQPTKKLCLRPLGGESRLAASALAGGLVLRDPGGSLLNDYVGRRMDLTGVEHAAPVLAPRLEWSRFFPLLGVSPASGGNGVICLPQKEASPLAQLVLQSNLLKGCDRNLMDYTSSLVVTVVGEARHVILKSGYVWSSEMQRHLQTPLDSSADVTYALRYATVALNYVVRQVLLYLAPKTAPLDILADSESTLTGNVRDSYDQLALVHKVLLIFSRFPLEMQKEGGLGAVQRELRQAHHHTQR